jgi:hypothetical protein
MQQNRRSKKLRPPVESVIELLFLNPSEFPYRHGAAVKAGMGEVDAADIDIAFRIKGDGVRRDEDVGLRVDFLVPPAG